MSGSDLEVCLFCYISQLEYANEIFKYANKKFNMRIQQWQSTWIILGSTTTHNHIPDFVTVAHTELWRSALFCQSEQMRKCFMRICDDRGAEHMDRGYPCFGLAAIFAGMLYNVQIIQKNSTPNIMHVNIIVLKLPAKLHKVTFVCNHAWVKWILSIILEFTSYYYSFYMVFFFLQHRIATLHGKFV